MIQHFKCVCEYSLAYVVALRHKFIFFKFKSWVNMSKKKQVKVIISGIYISGQKPNMFSDPKNNL